MRLRHVLPVFALATVGCAAGGTLASTITAPSALGPDEAFTCARNQLAAIDFSQTSYDVTDRRLTARRFDPTATRPTPTFRRLLDRLTIEIAPATGAEGLSILEVQAATFQERMTYRGPVEEEEKPSQTARSAARRLLELCAGSDSTVGAAAP